MCDGATGKILRTGPEGLFHIRLVLPVTSAGSALLLDGGGARACGLAARLAREGHLVGLVESEPGHHSEQERGGGERARVRDLAAAAGALGREPGVGGDRVGLVGLGTAAATALLAGCTQRGFAAVAALGGRVIHPELSAERPVQPVEMVHGLDAPLLVALAGDAVARGEDKLLREALATAAKHAEVLALAIPEQDLVGALGLAGGAGGNGEVAALWDALALFLADSLA